MAEKISDKDLLTKKLTEILAPHRAIVMGEINLNQSIEAFVVEYEQRMVGRIFDEVKNEPKLSSYLAMAMMMLRRMK